MTESAPGEMRADGHSRLQALTLGTAFCAGMALWPVAPGQVQAADLHRGAAVTAPAVLPPGPLAEAETQALRDQLRAMSGEELSLAYARIHASFRALLSHQDLGAARTLVDFAALADTELHRRRIARPEGTESPRAMLLLFELVL